MPSGLHDSNSIGPGQPPGQRNSLAAQISDTKLPTGRYRRRERVLPRRRRESRSEEEFGNVAVAGQDDVLALDVGDTLTLVAGLHVVITTNAADREITISIDTPIPTGLDDLDDVTIGTLNPGDLLTWGGSTWGPTPPPFVPTSLDDLDDVDVTGLGVGDHLSWDGLDWVPEAPPVIPPIPADLEDLDNVDATGISIGDLLQWDGADWVPVTPVTPPSDLDDLVDVDVTGITIGDHLSWDGVYWVPEAPPVIPTVPTSLDDLDDVDLTGISDGDILVWDTASGDFLPEAPVTPATGLDDLTDVDVTGLSTDDLLRWDGASWVPDVIGHGDLSDTTITTPALGQVIMWDGSRWKNSALPPSGISELSADSTPVLGGDLDVGGFLVDGRDVAADGTDLDLVMASRNDGLFMARKSSPLTTTTSYADINAWINPADIVDSDYSWDYTNGILTINTDGVYILNLHMMGRLTSSNRSELNMTVQLDPGGGGSYANVNQAFAANYAARQTSENQGGVQISGFMLELADGDLLKTQIQHATTSMDVSGFWSMQRVR